ncbi:MAG: ABC transporter ATP-binding protein [Ferruginibacter sp.]
MKISLQNAGKRFNREWVFRRLDYTFLPGRSYAITGPNGSGKSTLLQIIGGGVMHSEGTIAYGNDDNTQNNIVGENAYRQISFAAPYLELIEEMTANEFLAFHARFKQFQKPFSEMLSVVGLSKAGDKQIRYFSSGMKQRLKLAQAFFSNTSVLLLDEPLTNLDEEGISVYKKLWDEHAAGRLVIVSSNDTQEYERCGEVISIYDYKG